MKSPLPILLSTTRTLFSRVLAKVPLVLKIVKGLLFGGAHVVITTSRYSRSIVEYYQSIYHTYGSCGSALIVILFNRGSKQDVEALVDYIYNMDLDFILSFAGITKNGCEIDVINDKSELAHRVMLTNLRIFGAVETKKASR
ncbi:beta subunit of fatty acid synthetase [Stygiomarasmius scandens]|uniref:Beta subunit of fatty acid synthetase n=1 Tax=Marasmiellus scandens TaxID=2682957 RepID=A0ABR1JS77_9AGAR